MRLGQDVVRLCVFKAVLLKQALLLLYVPLVFCFLLVYCLVSSSVLRNARNYKPNDTASRGRRVESSNLALLYFYFGSFISDKLTYFE
jgi:hypothetical protein